MAAKKQRRKRKSVDVRRPFNVLLLDEEKAELWSAARADGRSLSQWIVRAALERARLEEEC
jgi:uncharacterized protein (DUF1778 family)